MTNVYTGLLDEPFDVEDHAQATAKLRAAGFRITVDDAGWIAEYSAGYHRVRVEAVPNGWLVTHVRVVGSFERVKDSRHCSDFLAAAEVAAAMADTVNGHLRLIGSVAGPLLAELRRTS